MNTIACFFRGLEISVKGGWPMGYWIEGHDYVEVENTAKGQTLRCDKCGKKSIGYYR
jgi:hypothetical protein